VSDRVLHAELEVEVRKIDEESRTAVFTAATERAVQMNSWEPPEVLRMQGAKLKRFKKNPVVLDTHNGYSLDAVIGRAEVEVKGRKLEASITYADTERGERAWRLVKGGFVRSVSIGYRVNRAKVKALREGEVDGDGDGAIAGPATIVRDWELIEVSNVPVPADEDAVRRSIYESFSPKETEVNMHGLNFTNAMGERGEASPAAATPPQAQAPTAAPVPATPLAPPATRSDEISEERAARIREARRREILAIAPTQLREFAEGLVLEGLDVEAARTRMKQEWAQRTAPVGTPEPKRSESENRNTGWPAELTDDVLLRSLKASS
jgi:hypothetical protein